MRDTRTAFFEKLQPVRNRVLLILEKLSGFRRAFIGGSSATLQTSPYSARLIKIYQTVDPKNILKEFKEKEAKFGGILSSLEQKHKIAQEKPQAEIFEGIKGMMGMLNELIEDAKLKDNYYFFAMDESGLNEEIQKFFEKYDAKREDRGLIVRGIAKKELKPLFENRQVLKMKYVSHQIPSNISICDNKMALMSWGEKPTGILIKSEQLCKSQIEFFESLWKTAKS